MRSRGFTLVEIAIVLAIVSLVSVGALNVISAQRTNLGLKKTEARAEVIRQALLLFAANHGRLPCPAVSAVPDLPATPENDRLYMREPVDDDGDPVACDSTTVTSGYLPAITLGITPGQAVDAWGNQFHYRVTSAATLPGWLAAGAWTGEIEVRPSVTDDSILDALAAVVSAGPNGNGAVSQDGISRAAPPISAADELANLPSGAGAIDATYSENEDEPFDDVVLVMTEQDVVGPLLTNGIIQKPGIVTRARLQTVAQELIGAAIADPQNRVPTSLGAILDEWGRLLVYNPGEKSADTGIWSGSTDPFAFTLRSDGPDGTASADDITVAYSLNQALGILAAAGVSVEPPPE